MNRIFTLFKSMLLDIRNEWSWYFILMLVTPLSLLFFLKFIAGDNIVYEDYLVGSIIMTFGTGVFLSLGQSFSYYKASSALDYYLSLPLPKLGIILAIMLRNIILSIPSLIVLFFIGAIQYHTYIPMNFPFICAIILTSTSLAGLGVIVGVTSKNMQMASILTQILNPILIYIAPVFTTITNLPSIVQKFSYFLPTTYQANALRISIHAYQFSFDHIILLLLTVITLYFTVKNVNWMKD